MTVYKNVRLDRGITHAIALDGMKELLKNLIRSFRDELQNAMKADAMSRLLSSAHGIISVEAFIMMEVSDR